jgi:hypothetical protein
MTEYSKKTATRGAYGSIAQIATPKALFFVAAGISFCLSVGLWFSGDRERGLFVGLWVPSILSAAILLLMEARHD